MTPEFLSHMLGVRRAGVTIAVNELASAGLIGHSRGMVAIVDPEGLALGACECYEVLSEPLQPPASMCTCETGPGSRINSHVRDIPLSL